MDIDETGTKSDTSIAGNHRYFPQGKSATKPSTRYQARTAKWRSRHEQFEVYTAGHWPDCTKRPSEPRPYQRAALATHPRCDNIGQDNFTSRTAHRLKRTWVSDVAEGQDLARSRARLPSDNTARGQAVRPPSLERQEAFRDARTVKRSTSGMSEETWPDEDDLYRMGLLYDDDDEQARGSEFGFWAVERPAYSVSYRRRVAGGARRGRKEDGGNAANLPLELSFAVLSDDEIIARYLLAPCKEEEGEDVGLGDEPGGGTSESANYILESQPTIEGSFSHAVDRGRWSSSTSTTRRSTTSEDTPACACEQENHNQDGSDEEDGDWAFLEQPYATFNEQECGSRDDEGRSSSTSKREYWVVLG